MSSVRTSILFNSVLNEIISDNVPRSVYIRSDHFNSMSDKQFFAHFRLTKNTVTLILSLIEGRLDYIMNKNNCVSPINQLLVTLRYFATGCHQLSLSHFGGMHKSTVCRITSNVSKVICSLRDNIRLPSNDSERRMLQTGFLRLAGFPRVIAAIDCTHVKIQSPGGPDAEIYRNRKGYFSINVQATVDSNYKFLDLVARWPGSTHDATIFANSILKSKCDMQHFPDCFLLGDSGYAAQTYLLTPLLNPQSVGERLYNRVLY